jgi:hypothetical protein
MVENNNEYTQQNDIDKLLKITKLFNKSLIEKLSIDFEYLQECSEKVEINEELTVEERDKIYQIGDYLYEEVYSNIGRCICDFNDIKNKSFKW